ncbi:ABC transporter ATP-binding protein [Streptomyces fuscichromogenes]|uniref:Dipeptide/oligopeptide/nickel ABC transporter ATP-binding protein n=1 Tax=Streptomyces fuscichromogenes TaxID=1324013 RepID=A0A918CTQ0_9ACTN|nr:ABC transporter ATP-binding protein [Streptomyces fuscichromogenes]GGN22720.1 dipeptide/oligopeptide/nickel ABC transporter ATP-binding protein [Streptomyces fuscichromogenes]
MSELRFEKTSIRVGHGARALTAVDGVDLVVPARSIVGLIGESGSGKSTLGRAAVGLNPVSGGRILLDGQPLARQLRRGAVQMVFQDPMSSLDPRMTIGDSIAESISRRRIRRATDRRREVERLLELLDLEPQWADEYPEKLSGGQRQRIALARALAARPEVLIADEITSALDVSIQGSILNQVKDLQRQFGFSMLFISHNLSVVRYLCDQVAVIYLGRLVEQGPAEDVLSDPQHPYTRELLEASPDSGGPLVQPGGILHAVGDGEATDPHHPPTGCRYHPRCPVGPAVHPDRNACRTSVPLPLGRAHHAACHFAAMTETPLTATT